MAENMLPPLTIRLFGTLDVLCAGTHLPQLRTQKGKWLLALLTLKQGKQIQRAWLADMLWPDDDQARNSLNTSLSDLRRVLGTEVKRLSGTPQTLCLDLTGADVDVITFDAAIQSKDLSVLKEAILLYTGPLLEDCSEPWVVDERENRASAYISALERLARRALEDADHKGAITWLKKAAASDVLQENLHRSLMQVLLLDGSYTAALEVYYNLRGRLRDRHSSVPEAQTTELYSHILQMARERAANPSAAQAVRPELSAAQFNIPLPVTALLGRSGEMQSLVALVLTERVVTLTGPGGLVRRASPWKWRPRSPRTSFMASPSWAWRR